MASGTPSAHKRSSLHRLSHTILSLASPSFSRVSFDPQGFGSRRKTSSLKVHAPSVATTSSVDKHDGQSAYSPSILSAVDSQLSSPYTPLLPSSPGSLPPVDPAAVPPTTNDLSEEEKMKLMRKVRKLSRVLGEIPAVEEEDTEPSEQCENEALDGLRPMSPDGSKKQSASASARKSWRRSLTFGASTSSALLEAHDVRHARSLSALRPSLSMPRASPVSDTFVGPSSPITFARPDSALSHRDVSECGLSSSAPETQDRDLNGLRRRDSTASSVLLADQNVEQVQRTRAAKLSRHFGTNIPPEVLLRAASPPPPASPLALYPVPTPVLSAEQLPRRSASLRRKPKRPRPASLDIRPSSGLFSAPTSPLSPSQKSEGTRTLKRSKSLWSKRPKTADGSENVAAANANGDVDVIVLGLSEKQRIQNVKRAKKMAQLFGDNPPSALFQITNFAGAVVEPGTSTDTHRHERNSLATIISISTTSLSPSISATNKVRLRDSFISVVTTSSEVSGLILTEEAHEGAEQEDLPEPQELDIVDPPPVSPVPILSPIPAPRRRSVRPSIGPSSPPNRMSRVLSSPLVPVPRTPPPFSNFITPPELRPATAPPSSPAPSEFQTRRRRAAKLSKFFGVEVNELADALPQDVRATHIPPHAVGGVTFDDVALVYRQQPYNTSLVVAEATRRRFLGTDGDDVEERSMVDVIDRLRRMKST